MRSEKEVDRVDHSEEAQRLENEADEDPDGRKDGHQRGAQQDRHDDTFHPRAGSEIGLQAQEGEGPAEEGNDQRRGDADPVIE